MYLRLGWLWDRCQDASNMHEKGWVPRVCLFIPLTRLVCGAMMYLFTFYILTNLLFDMSQYGGKIGKIAKATTGLLGSRNGFTGHRPITPRPITYI